MKIVFLVFVILFAFSIVVGPAAWIKIRRKDKKIARMKKKLQSNGNLFRVNSDSGVTAICGETEFLEEFLRYGLLASSPSGAPWAKMVLRVKPTFTFAEDQSWRPAHTGRRRQLEDIGRELLESLTGESAKDLFGRELDELMELIVARDKRLFVPFAGFAGSDRSTYEFYGPTSLEDARKRILQK